MTTLHKLDEATLVMTLSTGKQYLISDVNVTHTNGIDTDGLEPMLFDSIISGMLDNARNSSTHTLSWSQIGQLQEFVQDKIEDFE